MTIALQFELGYIKLVNAHADYISYLMEEVEPCRAYQEFSTLLKAFDAEIVRYCEVVGKRRYEATAESILELSAQQHRTNAARNLLMVAVDTYLA